MRWEDRQQGACSRVAGGVPSPVAGSGPVVGNLLAIAVNFFLLNQVCRRHYPRHTDPYLISCFFCPFNAVGVSMDGSNQEAPRGRRQTVPRRQTAVSVSLIADGYVCRRSTKHRRRLIYADGFYVPTVFCPYAEAEEDDGQKPSAYIYRRLLSVGNDVISRSACDVVDTVEWSCNHADHYS